MSQITIANLTDAQIEPSQGTFVQLPATPVRGQRAVVTDATANTWGFVVTVGGGANTMLVWYNGTHWTVIGQ